MTKPVLGALLPLLLSAGLALAQDPPAKRAPRNWEVAQDGTVTVHGKVVFTDQKHDVHEKARGRVVAVLWYPEGDGGSVGANGEADFDDGSWTITFAKPIRGGGKPPTHVSFSSGRIDDAPVVVDSGEVALTDEAEFVVRLRAIPPLRLRVIDAETKRELDGVEVFRGVNWPPSGKIHPGVAGSLQSLVDPGKSPVPVPAPDDLTADRRDRLWVRAPDHAWQPVEVLFAEGGTREVVLPRAGSVNVILGGSLPAGATKLAVRLYGGGDHEAPLADFEVRHGRVEPIESLAAGSYEARLEVGEFFRNPRVLARANVTVDAGKPAELRLDVKTEVATRAKVKLWGVVVVPAGWRAKRDEISVTLEPLLGTERWTERRWLQGTDLMPGDKDGEYVFKFGDIAVGRYAIDVTPSKYQQAITVAEGKDANLRIEVPEPVEVVLRVVDENGKPRKGATVDWYPARAAGVTGGSPATPSAAADSHEIRIVAPTGKIIVWTTVDEYEIPMRTLQVSADEREFELVARTLHGVKVVLYEGDTKLPLSLGDGWHVSLKTLAGEEVLAAQRGEETLMVREAGTYVLSVVAPAGYRPVADRQVRVTSSPFPTIEIKVARK